MSLTLLLAGSGLLAGVFGALLGLGGGILIVPILTLAFGVPFREAVAVSLLAVITTSSVSAAVYLERRLADLRLGMILELGTAAGALVGGLLAFALSERLLAAGFAVLLITTSLSMFRSGGRAPTPAEGPSPDAPTATHVPGATAAGRAAPVAGGAPSAAVQAGSAGSYATRRLPLGFALSILAGVVSALLGVGGGAVKVPAMHLGMGVPLRVATATSNLMIGITASASAVLYLIRGAVDPFLAGPVVVGVFLGATAASRFAHHVPLPVIRWLFIAVLLYVAVEMTARALGLSLLRSANG